MNGAIAAGAAAVVIVAAILVFGAGGFMTTETSTVSEGIPITMPPADGSHGVVTATYKSSSGLRIFGWDLTPSKWEAQVMFVPPAGCVETEDDTVVAEGRCASVPAEGRLSGGGTDGDGNRLWTVSFEVSKECHNALEVNEAWPTTKQACATDD